MPYKGGVQLLPETQRRPSLSSYTSGNSYFYAAVTIGVVILIISAIMGGYKANLVDKINKIDGDLSALEKTRDKTHEQALIDASGQSRVMKDLLANKIYWSQALDRIQQIMQTSVTLISMDAAAEKGAISFNATAESYAAVAKQIAAFVAATGVKDISVGTIKTTTGGGVEFTGEVTIDTSAMLKKQQPKK